MTDRAHSLTVILDKDVRVDDIEPLKLALSMYRGVISVEENISSIDTVVAERRVRTEIGKELLDFASKIRWGT